MRPVAISGIADSPSVPIAHLVMVLIITGAAGYMFWGAMQPPKRRRSA